MSQKTREKYGIRLPVVDSSSRAASAPAPAAPPPGAVWNNIRRLWMVDGVACDPQPAAPVGMAEIRAGGRTIGFLEFAPSDVTVERVPPAVKVTA